MLTQLRLKIGAWLTYIFVARLTPKGVGPVMRRVFKIPLLFYRLGLSGLVPKWILILVTTGRRSGKLRYTPLEYGYHPETQTYFLMSGWRGTSDWYRNARANPRVQIWIDKRRLSGLARPAAPEEVVEEMESVLKIQPKAIQTYAAHSGVQYDGTHASLLRMAEAFPSIVVTIEET